MAVSRRDRGQLGMEVGETEDCMAEAIYQEPGCGWR